MILEGNEGLKVYAQNNVLSNEETCDKLKVSKQYLYRLINEEKLTPFKQMKGGYLFWKPDVLALDRKSTRLNSSHTRPSRMPSSA